MYAVLVYMWVDYHLTHIQPYLSAKNLNKNCSDFTFSHLFTLTSFKSHLKREKKRTLHNFACSFSWRRMNISKEKKICFFTSSIYKSLLFKAYYQSLSAHPHGAVQIHYDNTQGRQLSFSVCPNPQNENFQKEKKQQQKVNDMSLLMFDGCRSKCFFFSSRKWQTVNILLFHFCFKKEKERKRTKN